VLKHQDEVNKDAEYKEKLFLKDRQEKYRLDLEQQRHDLETKSKAWKQKIIEEEKQSLQKQLDFTKMSANKESSNVLEKKAKIMSIMDENKKNKEKIQEGIRKQVIQENQVVAEKLKKIRDEEERKKELEKESKQKIAQALQISYGIQEEMRKKQKEKQKEMDVAYKMMHQDKLAEDDKDRQRVIKLN